MPKISVLIPMYNRKHYIEYCVNSVLNQTFQDFEIIIRDDGSTDGSAEFVEKRYAKEISAGKIKLFRNDENMGETRTVFRLIRQTSADYFYILHSDDIFLPHALRHLYQVAELTNADVVHGTNHLMTSDDGIIDEKKLRLNIHDRNIPNQGEIAVVPTNDITRFIEWITQSTFCDIQYNLFSRKFVQENELMHFDFTSSPINTFLLFWIMLSKVFVKTSVPFYIRRDAVDSISRTARNNSERLKGYITGMMKQMRNIDNVLSRIKFFKENTEFQSLVKISFLTRFDDFSIRRLGFYDKGVTPEIWKAVESAFKEEMGDTPAFYSALLFNWIQCIKVGQNVTENMLNATLTDFQKKLSTPPRCRRRLILNAA